MQFEWVPLNPKAVPERPDRRTEEERKWNRFRFPLLVKGHGAATHIDFHPVDNYAAVCCGPRVHCYDGTFPNADPIRTFSKFKGTAFGASFRSDGKLLVAGGDEGRVRVYDERSRNLMKQFRGHKGAARLTRFCPDKVHVMSGGDDKSVRKWDVATETQVFSTLFHTDSVRCGTALKSSPDLWLTGAYDKRVLGLDTRSEEVAYSMTLEHPVEQLLCYGGDANVAVANGYHVSIYDLRALDRGAMVQLSNHAKTVTSLALCDQDSRLITGSVDQTVKIWKLSDFECAMTQRYSAPVLCLGMAPSNQFFAVGMADGLISMSHRPPPKSADAAEEDAAYQRRKGRGINHKPEAGDFRVPTASHVKRTRVDALLRKYQYREALDASLEDKEPTAQTMALISDLIDRRALDAALSGRDDESIIPILTFLGRNLRRAHYDDLCIDVFDRILSLYSSVLTQSEPLKKSILSLERKINDEINLQKKYVELSGQLETIEWSIKKSKV